MWIFGSLLKDSLWLYVPGLCALALAPFFWSTSDNASPVLMILLIQGVLDGGHIYSTAWRTYLNKNERSRSAVYFVVPIVVFLGLYVLLKSGFKHLDLVILYTSFFHNVRQAYGISKWYQKLNGRFRQKSDWFLYALCVLPGLCFAARDFAPLRSLLLGVYALCVMGWLGYELSLHSDGAFELNRVFSVGVPALLFGLSYLAGGSLNRVFFPASVYHSVAYIGLVSISFVRVEGRGRSVAAGAILVLGTTLFFGMMEFFVKRSWFSMTDDRYAFISAACMTLMMSHYIFDAFLWKTTHPDSKLIYLPQVREPSRFVKTFADDEAPLSQAK